VIHDTVTPLPATWRVELAHIRRALLDPRLLILLILALLAGTLAYQAPVTVAIPIGWLGDRFFLTASEGQAASDSQSFYGDEITDHARTGRSRWTHAGASLWFPGIGPGDLELMLRIQGWPANTLRRDLAQPEISLFAGGAPIGRFQPTSEWADYTFTIPASSRASDDLAIVLASSAVFTGTETFSDPRPKAVRMEFATIHTINNNDAFVRPALLPLSALALNGALWLLTLLAITRRPNLSFTLTIMLVALLAIAIALVRSWAVAILPWLIPIGVAGLVYAWRAAIAGYLLRLIACYSRGQAINYGLVVAGALWLAAVITWASMNLTIPALKLFRATFPDSLIYGMLGMCGLLMIVVMGKRGLPQAVQGMVDFLASAHGARLALAGFILIWGGYLVSVILVLPYVGHADYADNAVVARNLLAGRGWVVDYISQFYSSYPSITRPQETWPLMQPIWIAPFFAVFGTDDWVAKLPNLIFSLLLGLVIYRIGSQLWDRRIGLTAALILLTNNLFFKLVIYAASDLAFVLFALLAIWLLYRACKQAAPIQWWLFVGSALFAGLMILQKPGSGGIMALGMGLWLLAQVLRPLPVRVQFGDLLARLRPVLLWGSIAMVLLAPLIGRNLLTFNRLYYSTESRDAWILEYTDWDKIYAVYAPEFGGSGPPDRSWILRWGFDRTLKKVTTQFAAVRDYLIPSWQSTVPLAWLAGRSDKDLRLLADTGAWLVLLGIVGAVGIHRRLLLLLLMAFGPYTLFLAFYWHTNEERYWVALMPWLALLAAYALWQIYDRMAAIGDRRWAPLGLIMVLTALALVVAPSYPEIEKKVREEPQLYAADLDAYRWLNANTLAGSVMMTRNPWQLNWHSERPAVMIPYTTDRATLMRIVRHYNARYLVLDSLQRPDPPIRQMLNELIADQSTGMQLAYRTPVYVAEYQGVRKELQAEVYQFP
jgi:4-amino-4-deoxy-L-arabinose transferase-like glycosyltransferase